MGKTVIPIVVGGAYASDVVHAFFKANRGRMEVLSRDRGIDASIAYNPAVILGGERLKKLDLTEHSPADVAEVALAAIDHAASVILGHLMTVSED